MRRAISGKALFVCTRNNLRSSCNSSRSLGSLEARNRAVHSIDSFLLLLLSSPNSLFRDKKRKKRRSFLLFSNKKSVARDNGNHKKLMCYRPFFKTTKLRKAIQNKMPEARRDLWKLWRVAWDNTKTTKVRSCAWCWTAWTFSTKRWATCRKLWWNALR